MYLHLQGFLDSPDEEGTGKKVHFDQVDFGNQNINFLYMYNKEKCSTMILE